MHSSPQPHSFRVDQSYPCPSCRIGKISSMPYMESWGCGFCGQLFLGNQSNTSLQAVDPSISRIWFWNGRQWQQQPDRSLQPIGLWQGLSILLVMLPTALIGYSAYLFPTEPDSFLHELPVIWTGLTFLAHLGLVLYLLSEYYQIPFLAYAQALRRFWMQIRQG